MSSRVIAFISALVFLTVFGCGRNSSGQASNVRIERAKKLLAEAGYPEGKGFPKLEILYNSDEIHEKVAAAIQEMWRKNLGIQVELRSPEWRVYLDDLSKMRYQIARRGWIGDYHDPNTFIELMTSRSGNSNTGWASQEYDDLVSAAAKEADAGKRFEILRRAEKILMRDAPVMPLYFSVTSNCWKDFVKGLYSNLLDIHPLNEVYAEGRDTLVINNGTEVQTLDPGLARGAPEHHVMIGLYEGLLVYDPKTLELKPGAAERWEVSPDKKKYTFFLRDCEWSDGRKVVAQDFVYSWTRVLNPATPTDYAHQLFYLKGAKAYNSRQTTDSSSVGVRARDDRTLEVELEYPCHYFLELCAFFTYYPVRKDVIEKYGTNWTRPGNAVCNGPFKINEWKPTDSITIEKNPKYWNAATVRQPLIRFLPVENRTTAWGLYNDGACDWVMTVPTEQINEISKRPDFRSDRQFATAYYSFNVNEGPLKDRRVRLALTLAVDRELIVSKITKLGQIPAYHFTPPFIPGYESPRFDTEE